MLERTHPLRVLRYRIREGSGGAGWALGGDGIELQFLQTLRFRFRQRVVASGVGLNGGYGVCYLGNQQWSRWGT